MAKSQRKGRDGHSMRDATHSPKKREVAVETLFATEFMGPVNGHVSDDPLRIYMGMKLLARDMTFKRAVVVCNKEIRDSYVLLTLTQGSIVVSIKIPVHKFSEFVPEELLPTISKGTIVSCEFVSPTPPVDVTVFATIEYSHK